MIKACLLIDRNLSRQVHEKLIQSANKQNLNQDLKQVQMCLPDKPNHITIREYGKQKREDTCDKFDFKS